MYGKTPRQKMIEEKNFKEWLELKGLSEKSIKDYMYWFERLDLKQVNAESVIEWLKGNNNGVSRAMIKNLIQYVRTTDFPQEIKVSFQLFELPKQTGRKKQRLPKVIDRVKVHMIANKMSTPMHKLMVLSTFYLGLRSDELLKLTLSCFDWDKGKVRIVGKGNKERIVPLVPELKQRLIDFFNGELEKDPEYSVCFPMSDRYWRKILSRKSQKAIDQWVNPHLLRHSCGSYLKGMGLDLQEIAEFLGHSDIKTTQIYVHLDKSKLTSKVLRAFD